MDYTSVPRSLIYEDRRSLEDFDAYKEGSITQPFLDELLKFGSDSYPNIEENALWCLNNAFYICTMILLEKDPRPRIYQYKKVATREYIKDRFISDKYWSAVLSMVILLLQRLETPLTRFQDEARQNLLVLIEKDINNACTEIFNCFSKRLKEDKSTPKKIPNSMFAPRVIDKFAIKDVLSEKDFCWVKFTNYLDERYIHDIVKAFGTTKEEKLNVVEMIRQASHSFYLMGGTNDRIDEVDGILNDIDKEIELPFNPEGKKVSKETLVNEKQFDPTTYKDRIKELEEEIADLEKREGIDAPKAALLVRIVLSNYGGLPNNRENAWPIITNLWGVKESNAKKRLRESVKEETVEVLASIFKDVSPKIERFIREEGGKIIVQQKNKC